MKGPKSAASKKASLEKHSESPQAETPEVKVSHATFNAEAAANARKLQQKRNSRTNYVENREKTMDDNPRAKKPRFDSNLSDQVPQFGGPYSKTHTPRSLSQSTSSLVAFHHTKVFETVANRNENMYGLSASHNITIINIASGTSIQDKVVQIFKILTAFSFSDPFIKPSLVELHARGNAAAKLVSIVEIVKRQILKDGSTLFQYSSIDGVLTERPAKQFLDGNALSKGSMKPGSMKPGSKEEQAAFNSATGVDAALEENDEMDIEDDFEQLPMHLPRYHPAILQDPNRKKFKKISVITTYLSCVGVDILKTACGEQSVGTA